MTNYYNKYLKYKNKYLKLKNQIGGAETVQVDYTKMNNDDWQTYIDTNIHLLMDIKLVL